MIDVHQKINILIFDPQDDLFKKFTGMTRNMSISEKKISCKHVTDLNNLSEEFEDNTYQFLIYNNSDDNEFLLKNFEKVKKFGRNLFTQFWYVSNGMYSNAKIEWITGNDIDRMMEIDDFDVDRIRLNLITGLKIYDEMSRLKFCEGALEALANESKQSFRIHSNEEFTELIISVIEFFMDNFVYFSDVKCYKLQKTTSNGDEILISKREEFCNNDLIISRSIDYDKNVSYSIEFCVEANNSDYVVQYINTILDSFNQSIMNYSEYYRISDSLREMVINLSEIIETRTIDETLVGHTANVSRLSEYIGRKMDFSDEEIRNLAIASALHDIGKVAIKDEILLSTYQFNDTVNHAYMNHTQIGYDLLKDNSLASIRMAAYISLMHHENWDGTGYPYKISGQAIYVHARIVKIADEMDVLSRNRVFRDKWSWEEILKYISDKRGKFFDPRIVDIVLENKDDIRKIIYNEGD